MKAYFLRRLLLIPLTLVGITALVFAINRMAPGGPVERALAGLLGGEGGKRTRAQGQTSLAPEQVLEVEEKKNRDKSSLRAYAEWLGVAPRDKEKIGKEFPKEPASVETLFKGLGMNLDATEFPKGSNLVDIAVPGTTFVARISRQEGKATILPPEKAGPNGVAKDPAELARETAELDRWRVHLLSPEELKRSREKKLEGGGSVPLPEYAAVLYPKDSGLVEIMVPGTTFVAKIVRKGGEATIQPPEKDGPDDVPKEAAELARETTELARWEVRLRSPEEQKKSWDKWMGGVTLAKLPEYRAVLFRPGYDGLLQGSLGSSEKYQEPVGLMILDRLPVSLYFFVVEMLIIYSVCLPLGILKAIKHRTWVDNSSSVAIFAGFAVPGYALGALLVVMVGARLGWLPIRGFTGDDFETLSTLDKAKDLAAHTLMPLACYLIGSFAFMTMLMKNNLMDNLAADYVRTATAKGVSYPRAVFHHAFRNSIIPIATTLGDNLALLVAGSVLVERVFDIDGFGMLQFTSVIDRDEPVMLGVLFFAASLTAIGKILSDLAVALVDPRVSYK